jgi:GDP/UDP-N,N'-diacetylbacillosamine 2-epimerase (hydrolysing)
MIQRKICVVTTTRAEYGLLKPLLTQIKNDPALQLQLLVSGTHLSPEHGETYKEIEKDFHITQKIPMQLQADDVLSTSRAMAQLQIDVTKTLQDLQSDIVVVLGDRYEIMAVAIATMMLHTPLAHIHGGETTEGAIDEAIRHSITKMAHLHFPATEAYAQRVIQLGEDPKRVFQVGALGVENIQTLKLLDKSAFEESIGVKLQKRNLLVTYHPETLSSQTPKEEFSELLSALKELDETLIIFTKANVDSHGKIINSMIDEYVLTNSNSVVFSSLGQLRYLSALQFVDAVVGNSSSGIIEVPSFHIATINIGDRQKGRTQSQSIINIPCKKEAISKAIKMSYSNEFQELLKKSENPYKSENTSFQIKEVLKTTPLENILKKSFYTIEC